MCLLSQGRTAFAPCYYEIKERDLTLCACQLQGVAELKQIVPTYIFDKKISNRFLFINWMKLLSHILRTGNFQSYTISRPFQM